MLGENLDRANEITYAKKYSIFNSYIDHVTLPLVLASYASELSSIS